MAARRVIEQGEGFIGRLEGEQGDKPLVYSRFCNYEFRTPNSEFLRVRT